MKTRKVKSEAQKENESKIERPEEIWYRCPYCGCGTNDLGYHWALSCNSTETESEKPEQTLIELSLGKTNIERTSTEGSDQKTTCLPPISQIALVHQ
jgi:hypothetical protein